MKKIFAAMAIAAMAAGFTASAQTDNSKQQCPANANCPNGKVCPQTPCAKQPCAQAPCPFDGLNLTDAQKKQLNDLCTTNCTDAQAKKLAKQQAKAERRQAKLQSRRDRLAKIKAILTHEQYVQFLENNFVQKGGNAPKAGKRDGKRGPAPKGQCPRGPRPEAPAAQK